MDNLTKEQRRKNMQNIRSTRTVAELIVMRELKRRKIYFSKHVKTLPGKPDIVFRKKKIVIFVDSDFWHGHKIRFVMPKTNLAYWKEKLKSNKKRDKKNNKELRNRGWKVIRIWEYDIKKNVSRCLQRVMKALNT